MKKAFFNQKTRLSGHQSLSLYFQNFCKRVFVILTIFVEKEIGT